MCELSPVTFHGDTIFCIDYQSQPFTPMRPIVENMGLGWASQSQKLNANKERWTVTNIVTVAQDGNEREMLCLPVRKLPAWLNSINPKKVAPQLRPKIELYQAESDDALWDYWINGKAERASTASEISALTPEQQAQLHAIVDAKAGMVPAEVRRKAYSEIWSRFGRHFQIARYVQLPAERMGDAVEYLVGMELRTGKAALPERTVPELPPAVLKVTEQECQALTDDITRAHIEAMRLLKPVKDRLSNVALRLAIETEQRAGMRALRHGEGESLQGMLFAGTGRMFAEAVMYPNEYELPVYCNPGFFLLGICRQLRAGDRA